MARSPRSPHELRLRNHKGYAVCTFRARTHSFGRWDVARSAPTHDALAKFQKQVAVWAEDPDAEVSEGGGGEFLVTVWADWLDSPFGPKGKGLFPTATHLFFGVKQHHSRFAGMLAADFTPADLLDWQTQLCETPELDSKGVPTGRRRYCRLMVLRFVNAVKQMFYWAAVAGRVDRDRAAAIRMVPPPVKGEARPSARIPAVPEADYTATLPHVSPPVGAIIQVLRWCGARPGEVLDLVTGDIVRGGVCWAGGVVPIDLDSLGVWAAVRGEHKNRWRGHERVIFFGPRAQAVLAPLLGDDPSAPLFRPSAGRAHAVAKNRAKRKPGGYGSYKKPKGAKGKQLAPTYSVYSLAQAVERAAVAAKVPHWTPKQLRKLCLALVQAKHGIEIARAVAGHAPLGVTQRNYTGVDFTGAARAMAEMG